MSRPSVVISAPGAGLGHLTRASAVAHILDELGCRTVVISNSPFSTMVERATGIRVIRLSNRGWGREARRFVARARPDLLLIDTFPFGLRGEWLGGVPSGTPCLCIGRNLHLPAYLERLACLAGPISPGLRLPCHRWILAEPISPDLLRWAEEGDCAVEQLAGPITLDRADPMGPCLLGQGHGLENRAWLVAHSGPPHELRLLVEKVQAMRADGDGIVVASPTQFKGSKGMVSVWAYPIWLVRWPVEIAGIVTGAGYNAMAHLTPLGHAFVPVPFPRRFDRQEERLEKRDFFSRSANQELAALLARAA